jgi:hypothetical protein
MYTLTMEVYQGANSSNLTYYPLSSWTSTLTQMIYMEYWRTS